MTDIAEERWSDAAAALAPLFHQQHLELSDPRYIARLPLDVDWEMFARLEETGHLLLVVAREEGQIVGYTITFLHTHPHYRTARMAHVDTYWLHPDHREPGDDSLDHLASTGAMLIMETEELAAKRGAVKMILHTRLWKDNQRLFTLLGFAEVERLSTKWIGG